MSRKLTPLQPGEPQASHRPGLTSPGPQTCCAAFAEPAGTSRAATRADLPPPRVPLPPARHFHTSGANQGRVRRQAPPRAARDGGRRPCPAVILGSRIRAPGVAAGTRVHLGTRVARRGHDPPPRIWGRSVSTGPAGGAGDCSRLLAAASGTGGSSGAPRGGAAPAARRGHLFGFPGDNPPWTPLLRAGRGAATDPRVIMNPTRVGGTGCRALPGEWGEGTQRKPRLRSLRLILNCLYYTDTELRTDRT